MITADEVQFTWHVQQEARDLGLVLALDLDARYHPASFLLVRPGDEPETMFGPATLKACERWLERTP